MGKGANKAASNGVDDLGATKRRLVERMHVPTDFARHPGGETNLTLAQESERPDLLFLAYHLGCDMENKIPAACKAKLVSMPARGPLYNEVHEAVKRVKAAHPEQWYVYRAWCLLTTVMLPLSYALWVVSPSILKTANFSFWMITYFFNIFHMRLHKGAILYQHALLDRLTQPLYTFVDNSFGVTCSHWIKSHNGAHHLYTNQLGHDPDTKVALGIVRFLPSQPLHCYNALQMLYIPLLFALLPTFFAYANITERKGPVYALLGHLTCLYALPYYLNGLTGLAYMGVFNVLAGGAVGYLFSVSHNNEELKFSDAKCPQGPDMDSWIRMQVGESISWGGYVENLLFGGINLQIEHHICPAVDSTLYYYLMPELKRICKKHGLKYTYYTQFPEALMKFHKYLYLNGNNMILRNIVE